MSAPLSPPSAEPARGAASVPPALELHDLTVAYRHRPVLYGVDLAIGSGRLVGVIGPNGAGKSTLLKASLGLLPAESGWVKCFGQTPAQARGRIGYVPQRESVDWDFPVTVFDVVLMGRYGHLGLFKRPRRRDRDLARACLDQVGLADLADRQIAQLSGGQQQRVFLARALAQEADLYFFDEPFAGVDAATEAAIITLLRQLRDQGKTLIVVHHDLATAPGYFDEVVLLNLRLVAYGPTATTFTWENLQKTYGGRLNILSEVAWRRTQDSPPSVPPL